MPRKEESTPESSGAPPSLTEHTIQKHRRLSLKYTPSRWLQTRRPDIKLTEGWEFWLDIYDDLSPIKRLKKGSQIGGTVYSSAIGLHWLEMLGIDVLYLFPTAQGASEFSAGRFNPWIKKSPILSLFFTDVDNVHHKRAGDRNFYCRGSNSESQVISIPVGGLVIDEFDRMNQDNLNLARDRLQGQKNPYEIDLSTPTFPGVGIDDQFSATDQMEYLLGCTNCQERRPLTLGSLNFEEKDPTAAHWQCVACGKPWSEKEKLEFVSRGTWVAQAPEKKIRGYHLPSLLSPQKDAIFWVMKYLELCTNEKGMQDFYNSVLGEAYAPEGTRFTMEMIAACQTKEPYRMSQKESRCVMGVDVGRRQHVAIGKPISDGILKIVKICEVQDLEDIKQLMVDFDVRCCVIDMMPETQKAREIQREWRLKRYQSVWLANYPSMKGPIRWNAQNGIVDMDRTEAIDHVLAKLKAGMTLLPQDVPRDFHSHLRSVVRVNETDKRTGNLVARWKETKGADHYLHAMVYCEAAAFRVPATKQSFVTWL